MRISNESLASYHLLPEQIVHRREVVFLFLAGTFFGAMTLLNVIGLTRFVSLGPLAVAVGVLPYPITFLCTDLISELYGRSRANTLVWVGLFLNFFILLVMWLANALPPVGAEALPPWQVLSLTKAVVLPSGTVVDGEVELFSIIYRCTTGAVMASMVAYVAAQFVDVWLFHFWKRLTKGRHLWVRNNFSTMISQLVDSLAVVAITFGVTFLNGQMTVQTMFYLLLSNYAFKFFMAALDTAPLYLLVGWLSRYLQIQNESVEE